MGVTVGISVGGTLLAAVIIIAIVCKILKKKASDKEKLD
jgi:hypothetical protein